MSKTRLCQAIARRATVSFTHRGERYKVEPFSVGYEEQDARGQPLLLRGWHENGWRDFEVKFMSRLEIDSQPFPADRQGHQKMAVVLCDVYGKSWPR
ncbi:hypothetical protein BjapCC829_27220 [Bradyrhizobium barranii]|uniref:WYL domain-containing protein n=1 Tax=Bradyrhizobium barranii TaxID=2992140 RepID=A0ABY3QCI0_9BRAD|nr:MULTISPECIES: hypothetical protein [Bradyrhizobium]UFW83642.1 hypothetical protein BjapCC829_27220 [Bradyrhizobium japonicum]